MYYEYTVTLQFNRGDTYTTTVLTEYHPNDAEQHEKDILSLVIEQCERDNAFAIIPDSWIDFTIELTDVVDK